MCKHLPVQDNFQDPRKFPHDPSQSIISLEAITVPIPDTINEHCQASILKRKSPYDSIVQTRARTTNLVQFTNEETGREGT